MRKKLVMGNWKLNGSIQQVQQLTSEISKVLGDSAELDVVIFPPFPYLGLSAQLLGGSLVNVGGQDVSAHVQGAYTGEVSSQMLLDIGCEYVLLGHSERRAYHHETNILVAEKLEKALDVGLIPVICVGESERERELDQTFEIIGTQLQEILGAFQEKQLTHCVIAYEPVWAIGTGKTATPLQAEAVHQFIRTWLEKISKPLAKNIRIVYGGSVKSSNAAELFQMANIDGALVGGASLNSQEFIGICQACRSI